MKFRKVIESCIREHDIQTILVLDGYNSYYSGDFRKFYEDCDPDMIELRDQLLEREVAIKSIPQEHELIIYLMAERNKK